MIAFDVDEERKPVLDFMAAILGSGKLARFERTARVPATICAIEDAIRWSEEIVAAIDAHCPTKANQR
jgi:hypothetical protein